MNMIKDLLGVIAGKKKLPADFTVAPDAVEEALRDEFRKLAGNYDLYRRNKLDLFEILQESFDEVLPNKIDAMFSAFAEVRFFRQGQRPVFTVRGNKQRGKQFVTRVALSGVYETFRLDMTEFDVTTAAVGGAAIIDFERYLDGVESLMELYDIILEGMSDYIYKLIQEALLASWNAAGRPSANRLTMASFDPDSMFALVQTVSAYGAPIIFAPPQFAARMSNFITYTSANPNMPNQDLVDIRETGYIGRFRGTPIVILPQSFTDETNSKYVLNPRVAYVIPAGKERIVKIAFEGNTIVDEWKNRDRSVEIQVYRKLGVGIIGSPNYWGMAQNTSIADDNFAVLPATVVTPTTKSIVYTANGGVGNDVTVTLPVADSHGVLANMFTAPATKQFDKWNTKADGTGTGYDPADPYAGTTSLVLFATWKAL